MAPPQWAYQPDNFVNRPDEELVCSICRAVFCEPVMTMCSHVFCKACIAKWLSNSRNCPICRKRAQRYNPPQPLPIVKNIIMKLTVNCHNKQLGCSAQASVESCESHMKDCNFEMVHCKNKPCKEQAFRKDIAEHESKGCLHRYIKCGKCGSKMSLANAPHLHDCTRALLFRLKRRKNIIRKKNEKIKALKRHLKKLKEAPSQSSLDFAEQSNSSSEFQDISSVEIVRESSSDSSNSYIETFEDMGEVEYYESDSDQSSIYQTFFRTVNDDEPDELQAATSYVVEEISADDQNNAENGNNSSSENRNNGESSNSESLERSSVKRAAKRRHPPVLFPSSEDENDGFERPSISSPKRVPLARAAEGPQPGSTGESSMSFMEAGPSHTEAAAEGSSDDGPSITELEAGSIASKSLKMVRQKYLSKIRKSKRNSKFPQNSAVFQKTLSLLEQYNLESDPEWKPAFASHRGDTTTESDTDYDFDLEEETSSSGDPDLQ